MSLLELRHKLNDDYCLPKCVPVAALLPLNHCHRLSSAYLSVTTLRPGFPNGEGHLALYRTWAWNSMNFCSELFSSLNNTSHSKCVCVSPHTYQFNSPDTN